MSNQYIPIFHILYNNCFLPFQLIRGMSGTKGNSLRMTEADMKLLLASKQQLQAQQKAGVVTTSQQQSVTQLLQGIQSGQVCQIFLILSYLNYYFSSGVWASFRVSVFLQKYFNI